MELKLMKNYCSLTLIKVLIVPFMELKQDNAKALKLS